MPISILIHFPETRTSYCSLAAIELLLETSKSSVLTGADGASNPGLDPTRACEEAA